MQAWRSSTPGLYGRSGHSGENSEAAQGVIGWRRMGEAKRADPGFDPQAEPIRPQHLQEWSLTPFLIRNGLATDMPR